MKLLDKHNNVTGLGLTSVITALMLSGCAGKGGPLAEVSASQSDPQFSQQVNSEAIAAAEAAVQAQPQNFELRAALGDAYLDAGRFSSAETSFADAMNLGDYSPRMALSRSLAMIAQAKYRPAANLLETWEGKIANADLGLALALAGQAERGIHIMSNAIRGGENTVKMRQNLAFAYAISGQWRKARLMVEQDVPASQVNGRIEEWAGLASANAHQARIAGLLNVPVNAADPGQPFHLALNNTHDVDMLASQTTTPAPLARSASGELAPVSAPAPLALAAIESPVADRLAPAPAPIGRANEANVMRTVSRPVVQAIPNQTASAQAAANPASAPQSAMAQAFAGGNAAVASLSNSGQSAPIAPRYTARSSQTATATPTASPTGIQSSHLVQLGSFATQAGAERAKVIFKRRHSELANQELVITQAVVRGRTFYRVSAGGFNLASSQAMCRTVVSTSSDGCFSWAYASPLPGAIETDLQLARR